MIRRTFIPGSEWLYLKIYTGHKSADNILLNYLYPMSQELKSHNVISDFFFIRYSDPKFHIRFRMRVGDPGKYSEIWRHIVHVLSPCIENGLIITIQCDTYYRELERYGEECIAEIESLFCTDSRSILELLLLGVESITAEEDRWKLSLLLIDDWMTIFAYTDEDKKTLMEKVSQDFKNEFGFTSNRFTKQLNEKYRRLREDIACVLERNDDAMKLYEKVLGSRTEAVSNLAVQIGYKLINKQMTLESLIHMTMNRLFRSKNRLHEMVIYDFLMRHYRSSLVKKSMVDDGS